MTDNLLAGVVYVLCLITSLICAGLLIRTYVRSRTRLLLWTALSFALLAANNLFLVADMLVFHHVDLWPFRAIALQGALVVLLFGFVWEADR